MVSPCFRCAFFRFHSMQTIARWRFLNNFFRFIFWYGCARGFMDGMSVFVFVLDKRLCINRKFTSESNGYVHGIKKHRNSQVWNAIVSNGLNSNQLHEVKWQTLFTSTKWLTQTVVLSHGFFLIFFLVKVFFFTCLQDF